MPSSSLSLDKIHAFEFSPEVGAVIGDYSFEVGHLMGDGFAIEVAGHTIAGSEMFFRPV